MFNTSLKMFQLKPQDTQLILYVKIT